MSHKKLCPVHRGFIAMSGRVPGAPGPSQLGTREITTPMAGGPHLDSEMWGTMNPNSPGAPGPSPLGTGDTTNPMRANSERLAPPQVAAGLADNFPSS